jgi:hypothetical protein
MQNRTQHRVAMVLLLLLLRIWRTCWAVVAFSDHLRRIPALQNTQKIEMQRMSDFTVDSNRPASIKVMGCNRLCVFNSCLSCCMAHFGIIA